jgi:DNA repair protein RadC
MSQRGIRQELLDIALQYGELVQDKVILGKKALQLLLNELQEIEKQTLKAIDKGGIVVVVSGEQLITTYNLNSYSRRKVSAWRRADDGQR